MENIKELAEINYNLIAIFKEYCSSTENIYIEQCQILQTLANILSNNSDRLLYEIIKITTKEDLK